MNNTNAGIYSNGHSENFFQNVSTACGIVMLLIFLCASVLSSSVLWALWKSDQLKYPVYRLIGYLLLDEVLVRIFGSPLIVTSILAGRWLYGDVGCFFYAFWMTWLGVTATSLFTCVAVERYIIMCRKNITHRISTTVVDVMGLVCYLHGLVWAILPLVGVNRYVYEPSGVSCTPNWSRDNVGYILGLFTVCVLMPVTVSLFCYSAIFFMVRRRRQEAPAIRKNADIERKVAVTVSVTMSAFLFAWTPYSVIGLHNTLGFGDEIKIAKELTLIPLVTAKTAGLWNPLIFGLQNRKVRDILAGLFRSAKERLTVSRLCWQWTEVPAE